jgi:hypothetical protein
MRRAAVWPVALVACALATGCQALYLPGVAPQDFARDDLVYVKARASPAHGASQSQALGVAGRDSHLRSVWV